MRKEYEFIVFSVFFALFTTLFALGFVDVAMIFGIGGLMIWWGHVIQQRRRLQPIRVEKRKSD